MNSEHKVIYQQATLRAIWDLLPKCLKQALHRSNARKDVLVSAGMPQSINAEKILCGFHLALPQKLFQAPDMPSADYRAKVRVMTGLYRSACERDWWHRPMNFADLLYGVDELQSDNPEHCLPRFEMGALKKAQSASGELPLSDIYDLWRHLIEIMKVGSDNYGLASRGLLIKLLLDRGGYLPASVYSFSATLLKTSQGPSDYEGFCREMDTLTLSAQARLNGLQHLFEAFLGTSPYYGDEDIQPRKKPLTQDNAEMKFLKLLISNPVLTAEFAAEHLDCTVRYINIMASELVRRNIIKEWTAPEIKTRALVSTPILIL